MNTGFKFTVFSLIAVFAIVVSQISTGVGVPARGVKSVPTSSSASKAIAQVAVQKGTIMAPIPGQYDQYGVPYTLGYLFDLINTTNIKNNKPKTSNFVVFIPGSSPSKKTAGNYGLTTDWIQKHRDVSVTLTPDDQGIIAIMENNGLFPKDADLSKAKTYGWYDVFKHTRDNFNKILLYFTVPDFPGKKFYIIDPWPQSIGSPIMWNKSMLPEQSCRAYRILMDWKFQ